MFGSNWNLRANVVLLWLSLLATFGIGYLNLYVNTAAVGFEQWQNQSHQERFDQDLSADTYYWVWALIVNAHIAGGLLGCGMAPYLSTKHGRKGGFAVGAVLGLFGGVLSTIAVCTVYYELIIIGRFIVGIGNGVGHLCLGLCLNECAPTAIRGLIGTFHEVAICMACLCGAVLGMDGVLGHHLPALVSVALVPDLLLLLSLIWIPETPKHILLNLNDSVACAQSIRFYHSSEENVDQVMAAIQMEGSAVENVSLSELGTNLALRRGTLIGFALVTMQMFCGMKTLANFSTTFLMDAGISNFVAQMTPAGSVGLNLVFTVVSGLIVDRFGRRALLLGCTSICMILLTGFVVLSPIGALWSKVILVIVVIAFGAFFSLGPGPIPWYACAELVPQNARSTVQAVIFISTGIISLVISVLFLPLYGLIGIYAFLVIYICPCVFMIILVYFVMPETKNREVYEISRGLGEKTGPPEYYGSINE